MLTSTQAIHSAVNSTQILVDLNQANESTRLVVNSAHLSHGRLQVAHAFENSLQTGRVLDLLVDLGAGKRRVYIDFVTVEVVVDSGDSGQARQTVFQNMQLFRAQVFYLKFNLGEKEKLFV